MKLTWRLLVIPILGFCVLTSGQPTQAQTAVPGGIVHAVLFYSPSCGHCHYVITEVLPPLLEKYGDQLQIVGVDASQPDGQVLFEAALRHFNIDSDGVPFLVVGDTYLVGSQDIPEQFPGLIEQYLAQGGVDWPVVPGLAEAMRATQTTGAAPPEPKPSSPAAAAAATTPATPVAPSLPAPDTFQNSSIGTRFAHDPVGNSLSVIVLLGMIIVLGLSIRTLRNTPVAMTRDGNITIRTDWAIPVLCMAGLVVAGYLAYVETTQVEAVCGPVGDCNTVQQSEYARLFGILPIGVMGILGYIMILLAWIVGRLAHPRFTAYAHLALLGMTAFGILFSIYLTFLEPFVIGATCAWCLTSAILMTVLFWLSLDPGKRAFTYLSQRPDLAVPGPDSDHTLER